MFDVSCVVGAGCGAGAASVTLSAGGWCNAVPGICSPEPRSAAFIINNRFVKKKNQNKTTQKKSKVNAEDQNVISRNNISRNKSICPQT